MIYAAWFAPAVALLLLGSTLRDGEFYVLSGNMDPGTFLAGLVAGAGFGWLGCGFVLVGLLGGAS